MFLHELPHFLCIFIPLKYIFSFSVLVALLQRSQNNIYIYNIYMYVCRYACMYVYIDRKRQRGRETETEKERLILRNWLMWGLSSLKSKG